MRKCTSICIYLQLAFTFVPMLLSICSAFCIVSFCAIVAEWESTSVENHGVIHHTLRCVIFYIGRFSGIYRILRHEIFRISHFAFCILHFAFCVLHFAFCISHFAVPITNPFRNHRHQGSSSNSRSTWPNHHSWGCCTGRCQCQIQRWPMGFCGSRAVKTVCSIYDTGRSSNPLAVRQQGVSNKCRIKVHAKPSQWQYAHQQTSYETKFALQSTQMKRMHKWSDEMPSAQRFSCANAQVHKRSNGRTLHCPDSKCSSTHKPSMQVHKCSNAATKTDAKCTNAHAQMQPKKVMTNKCSNAQAQMQPQNRIPSAQMLQINAANKCCQ